MLTPALLLGSGCSATPVGMAVSLAGEVVDDADAAQTAKRFVGAGVSEADALLNPPVDVLSDVNSDRTWRTYRVPTDMMDASRYVAEVHRGRIIGLFKARRVSDPVEYAAVIASLAPKVTGKAPADCEASLGMGPPKLTVRSQLSGALIQLYDARVIKELQKPHYCVLRFNRANACQQVDLVVAYSPGGGDPTQ